MLTVALILAPVFLLICTGYALRRGGIPSEEFWNLNDRLVYFVLMPALFFVRISEADLSAPGLALSRACFTPGSSWRWPTGSRWRSG
jgi:malonate transporter